MQSRNRKSFHGDREAWRGGGCRDSVETGRMVSWKCHQHTESAQYVALRNMEGNKCVGSVHATIVSVTYE